MAVVPFNALPPHWHATNGDLLGGGRLWFYESGNDDNIVLPVYNDHTGAVEYSQPIILDVRGEPPTEGIYLPDDKVYKIVLESASGSTLKSIDGYAPPRSITGPQGPQGEQGPQGDKGDKGDPGEVIYAESQSPAFQAYTHDTLTWNKLVMTLPGVSTLYRNWYTVSSLNTAQFQDDPQWSRTAMKFTATSAKRWHFYASASLSVTGSSNTPAAGVEFAIVSSRGVIFPARVSNVLGTQPVGFHPLSVSISLDLQVGESIVFACNANNLYGSFVFGGHQLSIPISSGGTGSDGKVLTSVNDGEASYLMDKIVFSPEFTVTEEEGSVGNKMSVSLAGSGLYVAKDGDTMTGPLMVSVPDGTYPTFGEVHLRGSSDPMVYYGVQLSAIVDVRNRGGQDIIVGVQHQTLGGQQYIIMGSIYGTHIILGNPTTAGQFAEIQNSMNTVHVTAGSWDTNTTQAGTTDDDALVTINSKPIATREYVDNKIAGGGNGYNFTQGTAAVTWTVNHNLSQKPIVQTYDSTGAVINGTIQHVSNNQLTITFASAQSGGGRCV